MEPIAPQLNKSWKTHAAYLLRLVVRIIGWGFALYILLWMYDAVGNNRYASRIYIDRADQYEVIAFGDSLVEGLGSENLVGFVGRLEQMTNVTIYNAGRRRDQTIDLVNRFETDVLAYHPKVVIMVIGGNDAVRLIPEAEVLANLEWLFARAQEEGVKIIFGEVTDNTLFGKRNQKIQDLASKYGVYYVPSLMKNIFWTFSKKFDVLHPDDVGYTMMAERIYPVLMQVLAEAGVTTGSVMGAQ